MVGIARDYPFRKYKVIVDAQLKLWVAQDTIVLLTLLRRGLNSQWHSVILGHLGHEINGGECSEKYAMSPRFLQWERLLNPFQAINVSKLQLLFAPGSQFWGYRNAATRFYHALWGRVRQPSTHAYVVAVSAVGLDNQRPLLTHIASIAHYLPTYAANRGQFSTMWVHDTCERMPCTATVARLSM